MVRKLMITILVILAVAVALFLGYQFRNKSRYVPDLEDGINNQPESPVKNFQGPTSSPNGIIGPGTSTPSVTGPTGNPPQ